jgi:flagellar hook-basal body complex protein FliE
MNVGAVQSVASSPSLFSDASVSEGVKPNGFAKVLDHFLGDANAQQVQADQAVQRMMDGDMDNIHEVMLKVSQADLSFRMMLEMRNKMLEAYQEISRMQF